MNGRLALHPLSPSFRRGALTLLVLAAIYEAVARSGYFPAALMPTLGAVTHALLSSLADGTMLLHAAATLYRVLIGFGLAVAVGLPLGVLMGRAHGIAKAEPQNEDRHPGCSSASETARHRTRSG